MLPGRRGLLPVGETRVRPVLGVLERLALVGLLGPRHGRLPGAVGFGPSGLSRPGLGRFASWLIACAMIWVATWLNLRGTRFVGSISSLLTVALVLAPFALLTVIASCALDDGRPGRVVSRRARPPDAGRGRFSARSASASRRQSGISAAGTTPRRSAAGSTTPPRRTRGRSRGAGPDGRRRSTSWRSSPCSP